MTNLTFPNDFKVMRAGLQTMVQRLAGATTIWVKPSSPSPQKPFVSIGLIIVPVSRGTPEERNRGPSIRVVDVIPSSTYSLTVLGVPVHYDSSASPTLSEIITGLVDALDTAEISYFVLSDDVIELTNPVEAISTGLEICLAQRYLLDAVGSFSIDAYASTPEDATILASKIRSALERESSTEELQASGWSMASVEGIRQMDQIAGAAWEGRSGFDLRLRCKMVSTDIINSIDSVDTDAVLGTFS